MNKQSTIILCVLASLALKAEAAIKKDGLWTGKDWYNNAHKIGVKDGVPYSNDEAMNRFLKSPLSYDGPIRDDWMTLKNVQLVNSIFPEEDWDVAFPHAHSIYTHENFLKAVSRFPAFCNETSESTEDDPNFEDALEQTCKRELATLFAHWGQETGKRSPSDGEFWT